MRFTSVSVCIPLLIVIGALPIPAGAAEDPPAATHPATFSAASSTTAPSTSPSLSPEKRHELERRMAHALLAGDYATAAADGRQLIASDPKNFTLKYNLACALARLGKKDEALATLGQSIDLGFIDTAHIQTDEDLASLHEDPRFAECIAKARADEKKAPFEGHEEINGVKTIEDFPDGGLRYRLRISPDATPEKPHRLIIWLHPSGGSADNIVERLSPDFAQRGFALVVFTRKQYSGWTSEEGSQLMEHTLPALAKIPGLDVQKPILMGFSAGGQMALELYFQHPADFGGLILNSAYPFDINEYRKGRIIIHDLPKDPVIKEIPILSIVGLKDGGSALWKKVQPLWTEAGIPLSVLYVPNQPHTYLIRGKQLPIVENWLTQVAAGKKPAGLTEPPATSASAPASRPTTTVSP